MNKNCIGCALSKVIDLIPADKDEKAKAEEIVVAKTKINIDEVRKRIILPRLPKKQGKYKYSYILNHSFRPYTLGHLVIQPITCNLTTDQLDLIPKTTREQLFLAMRAVTSMLQKVLKTTPQRVYFWSFNEQNKHNQPSWHFHIHIAPKLKRDCVMGPQWICSGLQRGSRVRSKDVIDLVEELQQVFPNYLKEAKGNQ